MEDLVHLVLIIFGIIFLVTGNTMIGILCLAACLEIFPAKQERR